MNSLLDLLPKGGASIVDSLANETKFFRRFLFLIQEAEEGIQHFLKGNLFHFDPHVGDTACQIRAYYFALLWTKREEVFPSIEKDLTQLKTYAEKMTILMDQGSRNLHRPLRPTSLNNFLEKLDVDLKLSEQGLILAISHLLSKYRWVDEEGISQRVDHLKLQRECNDSKIFSKCFFRLLQMNLSWFSVNWVIQWAEELKNFPDLSATPEVLKHLLIQGEENRWALPSFGTLQVILKHIRHFTKIPIVFSLNVLNEKSNFQKISGITVVENQLSLNEKFSHVSDDSACFSVRAVSLNTTPISNEKYADFVIEKLIEVGPETAMLWVNADHPQYVRHKESYFYPYVKIEHDLTPYFLSYESAKNQSFFYIDHFYADKKSCSNQYEKIPAHWLNRFLKKDSYSFKFSNCRVFEYAN